jgi:Domain of unknown function (DUF4386)
MGKISDWFPPFAGIIFVVLFVVVFALLGLEGQDATEKTAEEIAEHYQDNETKETLGSFGIGLAAAFMLFFGGWLRRFLRDAEGPTGILSAVAFGAAVVFSAGAAIAGSVHLALADLADDIDPIALQAINGIDYDLFLIFPVGLGVMAIAGGISALRHGALPKWLCWVGIVGGVAFFTPAFPVGLVLVPLWILIVSIIGISSARAGGGVPAAA